MMHESTRLWKTPQPLTGPGFLVDLAEVLPQNGDAGCLWPVLWKETSQ